MLVDGEVSEDIPVSLVSKHEQGIDDSVLWIVDADSSRDCGLWLDEKHSFELLFAEHFENFL